MDTRKTLQDIEALIKKKLDPEIDWQGVFVSVTESTYKTIGRDGESHDIRVACILDGKHMRPIEANHPVGLLNLVTSQLIPEIARNLGVSTVKEFDPISLGC